MNSLNRKYLLVIALSSFALITFMVFTNPNQVPLYLLLVPFILIFIIFFVLIRLLLIFFAGEKNDLTKFNLLSIVISIVAVNLILLRSVDQLTIQDAVLSTSVTVILAVYINKFRLLN